MRVKRSKSKWTADEQWVVILWEIKTLLKTNCILFFNTTLLLVIKFMLMYIFKTVLHFIKIYGTLNFQTIKSCHFV